MFRNRIILVLGVLSLLLVGMAVSFPRSNASRALDQTATDFYQRHPDWTWAVRAPSAIPVTGSSEMSDYFQRHPELTAPAEASVDLTDYYFRQKALFPSAKTIDLTDYYFRHP